MGSSLTEQDAHWFMPMHPLLAVVQSLVQQRAQREDFPQERPMSASSCCCGRKEQELAAGSRSHKLAPMGRFYGDGPLSWDTGQEPKKRAASGPFPI